MFELRAQGQLSDPENCRARETRWAFKSEIQNRYNMDHTKIIGHTGAKPLNVKQFQRIVQNTIYAGVLCRSARNGQKWLPIEAQYPGLVSH